MKQLHRLGRSAWLRFAIALLAFALWAPFASAAPATARIHYHRNAGDAATWQLYTWYGALNPSPGWVPAQSPTGADAFGVYYDVALKVTDSGLNFILHDAAGNAKNCPNDMYAPFPADVASAGLEIWQLQDDCTIYATLPPIKVGDVAKARAHFLARDTIAWPGAVPGHTYRLYHAAQGGMTSGLAGVSGGAWMSLAVDTAGLRPALAAKFPHLAGSLALKLGPAQIASLPPLLRGQLVVAEYDGTTLVDATSLQTADVLDDLFPYTGALGALGSRQTGGSALAFRVWAPTAKSVRVQVFDGPTGPASAVLPMRFDAATGVWSAAGDDNWSGSRYYAYEVTVYVRGTGRVETNLVADPYSLGAAAGSQRSLIVDLDDRRTQPPGWSAQARPPLAGPEDIVLYELHLRDFSASDLSVPAADRGKFRAFGYQHSDGMQHLKSLQEAGLTHVHLLPTFQIASVPDTGCVTPAVPAAAADSSAQQDAIAPLRDQDCYNWGYDPVLYTVPNASYASEPNGLARIVEFRQMVQSLHRAGLRVVLDVVYNHTSAAGQAALSVLDRIVPGYYHRLDASGANLTDSCCQDTAAENAMMGKLLTDSVLTWAKQYQVDGFRFDLMGFHPKPLLLDLKAKLARVDPSLYLYGEGWNFGAIANDARFVQATQRNLAGSGIGTFSDRARDAVRGGGPFDGGNSLVVNQGFINGLWYDPNALAGPATPAQRDTLNRYADWIRLGLAGTSKDYVFVDKDGVSRSGAQIDYNGQPAGYATNPADVINYISAHDNQTLFDNNQFKMPTTAAMADRVRVNSLGAAIVALSQGVAFFHAGDDLLRSKSMDRDSFNSGDWFNRLDLGYQGNNWGVGLPPAFTGNQPNWPVMQPLLANPALKPGPADIAQAHAVFLDWLKIRRSTPMLHLRSGDAVRQRLKFFNVGPNQQPGVIVMALDGQGLDPRWKGLVAVINAGTNALNYTLPGYAGRSLALHPVQAVGADPVVKGAGYAAATGVVSVPPRTAAVFVERR